MPMIRYADKHAVHRPHTARADRLHPVHAALLELVSLLAMLIAVPVVLFIDTGLMGQEMTEGSLTERLQTLLIVVATLIIASGAVVYDTIRGYLGAVTTLFACMAIRENDSVFDNVYHGFWLLPALAVLAIGAVFVWKHRAGAGAAFINHLNSHSGVFVTLGVLLLIVFSRLFGTGAVWEGVMGETYNPAVKAAVQEGLELLGYCLIAYGSAVSLIEGFGTASSRPR